MAEQTFRSPGFFENEVDLSGRTNVISGTPAGVIGTAEFGPAFVPVTVGSFSDFRQKFGNLDADRFGPYAVNAWLQNRTAVTYVRVLGAGANNSDADISTTIEKGTVKGAGFVVSGSRVDHTSIHQIEAAAVDVAHEVGCVQFLAAAHKWDAKAERGYPVLHKNPSAENYGETALIRGMLFSSSGSRIELLPVGTKYGAHRKPTAVAVDSNNEFIIIVSSSDGSSFSGGGIRNGIKSITGSLDPNSKNYITKVLNTRPERFHAEQHLLYGNFEFESEIGTQYVDGAKTTVSILSGTNASSNDGDSNMNFTRLFGSFNTRYQAAKTTQFISQPFGEQEYDLFHFEALDDGSVGNQRVKISISNLQRPVSKKGGYPTFNVLVRSFDDSDVNLKVLEQFPNCNLDPSSENYIASKIGDIKVAYNFDAQTDSERRLSITGKRPNKSRYVRVVMSDLVEDKKTPEEAMPFGFKGLPCLKTNDNLTDKTGVVLKDGTVDIGQNRTRLAHNLKDGSNSYTPVTEDIGLDFAIVPPVPLRYKCTRGSVGAQDANFSGNPGSLELADARYYWGIKFERVPRSTDISDGALNANASAEANPLIANYAKLLGIQKLDMLTTGSGADLFNGNKFTLAKVALNAVTNTTNTLDQIIATAITGSAKEHIREAAFLRDATVQGGKFTVEDGTSTRITFASLAAATGSASKFNQFSEYLKFTNMMYGGFDGVNILDRDQLLLNDKATSVEAGGKAAGGEDAYLKLSPDSSPGIGEDNNAINSYRTAAKIMTDPMSTRINVLAIPGIKEPLITNYASDKTREYSQAIYLMDIPSYDDSNTRLFSDSTKKPSVRNTIDNLNGRAIDNSYVATYFPDVIKADPFNNYHVHLPASIAALQALGYNDSVAFPWFAPAGFNRGALEDVVNTKVKLNTEDRNILYESRINPIASFPQGGFVIFGQKTLQEDRSALDRVNVRRMLLEVKRIVSDLATKFIFEQNTPALRAKFVAQVTPKLAIIQAQQGIDQFKVVMDSSNNTQDDIETNRLNGKIILVPTRAVEFIVMDFIITNSGVSFE